MCALSLGTLLRFPLLRLFCGANIIASWCNRALHVNVDRERHSPVSRNVAGIGDSTTVVGELERHLLYLAAHSRVM